MLLGKVIDNEDNLIMNPPECEQVFGPNSDKCEQVFGLTKRKKRTGVRKKRTGVRIDDPFFIVETGSLMYSQSMYPNQSTLSSQSYNISQSVYTPLDQAPGEKTDMMIEFAKLFGNI